MKKILITGATGFIGKHLVERLLKDGYGVRILARNEKKARELFGDRVEYIFGDLASIDQKEKILEGVYLVYYLASIRGDKFALTKNDYYLNNVLPTRKICELCLKYGSKLIYLSSSGVTGWAKKLPIDESFPYLGEGLYHHSKIEAEKEVLSYVKKGLGAVIARTVMVYGEGDDGFVSKLTKLIKAKKLIIAGNGKNRIHLVDIKHLVDGMVLLMGNFKNGEIYFFADEKPITINDLIFLISKKYNTHFFPLRIPLIFFKPFLFGLRLVSFVIPQFNFGVISSMIYLMSKDRFYSTKKAENNLGFKGGDIKNLLIYK